MNDKKIPEELLIHIQSFISTDSLLFIGSGISAAEGISGMPGLAQELRKSVPQVIDQSCDKYNLAQKWKPIEQKLSSGEGLESVLLEEMNDNGPLNEEILSIIKNISWSLIFKDDQNVLNSVLEGSKTLRLSTFMDKFNHKNGQLCIITTNYDRLVEYALDDLNITVNTLFTDGALPRFDKNSALERGQTYSVVDRKYRQQKRNDYALLLKPHGSISWMKNKKNGSIVSSLSLSNKSPCIITPGGTKYIQGYNSPFNEIIPLMNTEINERNKYIFIGYGFNDAHLENQLRNPQNRRKPCLIITKYLSDTHEILNLLENYVLIKESTSDEKSTTIIYKKDKNVKKFKSEDTLWDIQCLAEKIL
ncbi:hypothetical protein FGL74_00395 [Leuconostoc koreense]|nr:hypothetical protein FGL74_00395 [Leuconostoc mesenteroides]QGM25775.1 hypothetical protein GJV51_07240 [Leuconostoc mesenteroides subsp. mesenteroides]